MSQKFIIPPRTTDGNEIRKFFVNICQYINRMMEVDNSVARAYLSANQINIVHDTATKVLLDTETVDTGSNFSSYKYTFPVTGRYHITWSIAFTQATKMTLGLASIYIDGAEARRGPYIDSVAAAGRIVSAGSDVFDVTAGQYAELWGIGYHADAGANTFVFTGSSLLTYMSVHLIARA